MVREAAATTELSGWLRMKGVPFSRREMLRPAAAMLCLLHSGHALLPSPRFAGVTAGRPARAAQSICSAAGGGGALEGARRDLAALQREKARIEAQIQEKERILGASGSASGSAPKRILVIVPFPLDAQGVANRAKQAEALQLGPETTLDFRPIKAGCTSFESDHDWLLMDLGCYEAGINAEAEGYSAVVIDCTAELGAGVGALRSTLNIPVIGPGRVSCLYALMLGNKFGILASNEDGCFQHRNWVAQRGLSKFLAAVEPINGPKTDVSALSSGREDQVFPLMQAAAERAIQQGAEVIILGSTTMHEAGEWLSQRLPVPVVNPGPLSYAVAEAVLQMRHTHSRMGHPSPSVPKLGMISAMLDAAAAYEAADGQH
eukprot:Tamp_15438.p1 GENE.Tamp_15438~~Tamp_15438.p1  ORF type:complete len:375 (-),score=66.55 Tamp_15438:320-1444(-)